MDTKDNKISRGMDTIASRRMDNKVSCGMDSKVNREHN